MNIKDLTKNYLNTLPGLNEEQKEKIANFNANSDWIVFSAISTGPTDSPVTEYDNPETGNLDRFCKNYGGFKKVDAEGYLLIDESEYNPFYPHPDFNTRKVPFERRILDGINYKRGDDGCLKSRKIGVKYSTKQKAEGEEDGWERFQHIEVIDNVPVGTDGGVMKTTRKGVMIESERLSTLLEEVWNKVADEEDGHDVARIDFPEGAGVIDTPSYLNISHYHALPNNKEQRDKLWIRISKKSFENQATWTYQLSFNLNDIKEKQNFKIFPNTASLMNEINPAAFDNTPIQQYNQSIIQKLNDFHNRIFALCERSDELLAFFMSVEAESDPEINAQTDLIFAPQPLPTLKEELTGDGGDAAKKANNQNIENQNTQIIQNWENNFTQKKTALSKLEYIWNKISNPDTPTNDNPSPNQSPNNPPKPNTPNTPKPTPTQENSQKSEENIKDINNSSSVEQARTKTQTEINSLLERYGVKAEQLSTSLWENEASWEAYLNKLSAVDQVSQFIKRMKVAIMQQDKHNQKANQQLSVTQLKTNIKQNIKTLLKKYPQVKTDSNSILKDWEVALERENDKTKLTNLERQFREAIIASTNQKQTTADSQKSNLATKLLIGGSVILVLTGAAFSVVIIRNKRLKRIKKNS
ncbi:MAG: hypothetical protein MRERC_5c072 [Mycoplasmataceae bacterium RC_NB112A]|nr:MAG: hypothetical protein MRERC_5c072 [Mycoplasmataceae bacterium RC_NB112A]